MDQGTANGLLPFYEGPRTTYSELQQVCEIEYETRGPTLVLAIMRAIEMLVEAGDDDQERVLALSDLNDFSIELGAMNAAWNDFSTVCFMEYMDATRRSPEARIEAIKASFNATVERLRHAKGS